MRDAAALRAPAKVNLVLEITGVRPDGYHEIDTVLQTLELADGVTLTWNGEAGVELSGPFTSGTPADHTNLAWRAAELLAERAGQAVDGLRIHLDKRIPPAGGLGGGASDAGTVLRALGEQWNLSEATLLDVANQIGSDEAFFLVGGTARARGRGERVTALPPLSRHGVVLFVPEDSLERKTARMFAAIDRHPFDSGAVSDAFAARDDRSITTDDVFNAFERVAFDLFDGLAALWEALEARVGEPIRLAGAGPTLFWIGPPSRVEKVAAAGDGLGCTVIPTATATR